MELRHIRYFVAVAETLHFGRAAAKLGIAQPSLSHQVRQLERELQTSLFQRTRRRVQLTEAGRQFLDEARETLAHADRAAMVARRASTVGSERIRVAFAIWTNLTRIFAVIKRLNELRPEIRVDLRTMPVPFQLDALKERSIDVGFIRAVTAHPMINSERLSTEPFMVALPKRHPLAQRQRIPLRTLAEEPFIFGTHDAMPDFYNLTIELCRESGFVPLVRDEVDYPAIVLGLVAAGVGISLVAASIRKIQSAEVVYRPLQGSPRVLETSVAWRHDNTARNVQVFLDLVRTIMPLRGPRPA